MQAESLNGVLGGESSAVVTLGWLDAAAAGGQSGMELLGGLALVGIGLVGIGVALLLPRRRADRAVALARAVAAPAASAPGQAVAAGGPVDSAERLRRLRLERQARAEGQNSPDAADVAAA